MSPIRTVLSIGSNLGDREAIIRSAVDELRVLDGVEVTAVSGLVETPALKPHGVDHTAPAYLNAAVLLDTTLAPEELLDRLNDIERTHGRVREEHWGDRTLDIDIVAMEGITRATERLTLPHPRASERSFVLVPWLQLDPLAELPAGRVADLVAALDDEIHAYPTGVTS